MKRICALCLLLISATCSSPTSPSGKEHDPIWINARWSGGARGNPTNASTKMPQNLSGSYCPSTSVVLLNWDRTIGFNGLYVKNNCVSANAVYLCASGGTGVGAGDLPICASPDPLYTNIFNLHVESLPSAGFNYINTPIGLDVNVFYCPHDKALTGPGGGLGKNKLTCM